MGAVVDEGLPALWQLRGRRRRGGGAAALHAAQRGRREAAGARLGLGLGLGLQLLLHDLRRELGGGGGERHVVKLFLDVVVCGEDGGKAIEDGVHLTLI